MSETASQAAAPDGGDRTRAFLWITVAYLVAMVVALVTGIACGDRHPIAVAFVADVAATLAIFAFSFRVRELELLRRVLERRAAARRAVVRRSRPGRRASRRGRRWCSRWSCCGRCVSPVNWARGWSGLDHEDWRYVDLRNKAGRIGYWFVSLFGLHGMPTAIVFLGLLPLWPALATGTRPLGWLDGVAAAVTRIGRRTRVLRRQRAAPLPPLEPAARCDPRSRACGRGRAIRTTSARCSSGSVSRSSRSPPRGFMWWAWVGAAGDGRDVPRREHPDEGDAHARATTRLRRAPAPREPADPASAEGAQRDATLAVEVHDAGERQRAEYHAQRDPVPAERRESAALEESDQPAHGDRRGDRRDHEAERDRRDAELLEEVRRAVLRRRRRDSSAACRRTRAPSVGTPSRNENSAASRARRPSSTPPAIVIIERDVPGHIAAHWKSPIASACCQSMRFELRALLGRVAAIEPDHPHAAERERRQYGAGAEEMRFDRIVEQRAEQRPLAGRPRRGGSSRRRPAVSRPTSPRSIWSTRFQ